MTTREAIFQEFEDYLALSETMITAASKAELVKTARILAMQAAHYANKYGEELLDLNSMLGSNEVTEESAAFLRDGAKTFVGVLGVVAGGVLNGADETMQ